MSQLKYSGSPPEVLVTNSSNAVILYGHDATTEIAAAVGNAFHVQGEADYYEISSATPTFDGTDTTFYLTGNYGGTTKGGSGAGIYGVISIGYTSNYSIPELDIGDVDTPGIITRMMRRIDAIFSGSDAPTVRAGLVAGGMHKSDTRPAAANMNAGDKWADTDYGTNVCAVYCIVDPTNPALDALEAFVAIADGKWLSLDNSESVSIDCSAGGTITLTALQNAYGVYNLTGSPAAAFNLVVSTTKRTFTVNNATGKTATVKTSGGTGIVVPDVAIQKLRCDGTNVINDWAGSGWIIPTLLNGWTETDAVNYPVRYRKLANGIVIHEGKLNPASATSNQAYAVSAGYFPGKAQAWGIVDGGGVGRTMVIGAGGAVYGISTGTTEQYINYSYLAEG